MEREETEGQVATAKVLPGWVINFELIVFDM